MAAGIKAAADASNPSVTIAPGTYSETVLVETAVDISREGDGEVFVIGQGCHTISVLAGAVKLKGISVQTTGSGPWAAVFAGGAAAVSLEACVLKSNRGPALVVSSSAPCSATAKTSFSSNLGSGALVVNKASFSATDCIFCDCAISGLEVRDASSATVTSSDISNCRQSGVLSCDEGSTVTCNACTITNCLVAGARADDYGSATLEKCNIVRNQGSGCVSSDGGIITASEGTISSNAGHGAVLHAAAINLTNLHVDFNARHGVHATAASTVCLDNVQLVNNSQKGVMMSPRSAESASVKEVVSKDVWWPSPNCGPKEVYVD